MGDEINKKNKILAKQITSFNRLVLGIFIDDCALGEYLYKKIGESFYKDLWSACLLNDIENTNLYIWTLINERRSCNLPILLCPDDMDFWCTIVVAQVQFQDDTVIWKKIGLVKNDNFSVKQWRESGIQDIERRSERDWELYGSTLSFLDANDKAWEKWWSEHWIDEETRRLWNYFHEYFNNEDNIQWIDGESLIFSSLDYDKCILEFKQFRY